MSVQTTITNPKNTLAEFGKMPGSEGTRGQTAEYRQYTCPPLRAQCMRSCRFIGG